MKLQKKTGSLSPIFRTILFVIILSMGTVSAVMADTTGDSETSRLQVRPAQTMTVAMQDSRLLAAFIDPVRPTGIYQSEDQGDSWQLLSPKTDISNQLVLVHSVNSDVLYARASGEMAGLSDSFWRSDDTGQNWRRVRPGLPVAPYDLPWAISERTTQPRPPQLLYAAFDESGGYHFDLQQGRYGYGLAGILSPQAYLGTGLKDTMIAPDGRIYILSGGNDLYKNDSGPWRWLGALLEPATGLLSAHFNIHNQPGTAYGAAVAEQDRGRQLRYNPDVPPGAALRITALAAGNPGANQLYVAAAVYDQGRRWGDKGIFASNDGGRHWTRLADKNGLVVMQLPQEQPADEVSTDRALQVLNKPYPAIPFGGHSQPLNGTQVFIMMLAGSLAGLTLVDRTDGSTRPGQGAV